jgi:methylenetetrahydrofolate reductase (NADPH)
VSPFKQTEAETFAQYYKLCKKVGTGAEFAITQVGYDARKFEELIRMQHDFGTTIPTLGSVSMC